MEGAPAPPRPTRLLDDSREVEGGFAFFFFLSTPPR